LDWLREVKEDLQNAKTVKLRLSDGVEYDYIVNSLSTGFPSISSKMLWGCAFEIARITDLEGVDKILTPEAMGIHLAAALSMVTGIPMNVIRKRKYGLPDEIEIVKRTGYEETKMYINEVKPGETVVLVDSIIATGGTFASIIKALKQHGVIVQDLVAVIERPEFNGVSLVKRETGHVVKTLIKVTLKDVIKSIQEQSLQVSNLRSEISLH